MVSPEAERAAVAHMKQFFNASERRACGLIDQPRSTQRYQALRLQVPRRKRKTVAAFQAGPKRDHALESTLGYGLGQRQFGGWT